MKAFLLVMIFIAMWILGPLLGLWALNTLFPVLAIPYKLSTWLAMVLLCGLFKANISAKFERS